MSASRSLQILASKGIKAYRAIRKWKTTPRNKLRRLKWTKAHKNLAVEDWRKVIFSDGSIFQRNRTSQLIRARRENKSLEASLITVDKWDPKVMEWGCISAGRVAVWYSLMTP